MFSLQNPRNTMLTFVEEEMDKLLNNFFSTSSLQNVKSKIRSGYPKLDVLETDEEYRIEVAVPGVNPDDLKVEVVPTTDDNGVVHKVLKISGKVDYKYQYPESTSFLFKELRRSQFAREVTLKNWVNNDPAAEYDNGILRLSWKKPDVVKAQPQTIRITKKA